MSARSIVFRYGVLSFIRGLNFLSAVLTPFFLDWGKITLTEVGLVQTWFLGCLIMMDVPTGAFADRFGRKLSLVLGEAIFIVGVIYYGAVPSLPRFFVGEFLLALGTSFLNGADNAWLVEQLKMANYTADRNLFGKMRSVSLSGMLIGSPVGGLIATYVGINAAMQWTAIPASISLLIILTLPEVRVPGKKRRTFFRIIREAVAVFRVKSGLKSLTIFTFITYTAGYFVIWLYQPLLRQLGVDKSWFGLIHTILVSAQVIVCWQFDRLHKAFGTSGMYLRFSSIVLICSFLLAALYPSFITVAVLIFFGGGFGLTINDYVKASFQQKFEDEERATLQSYVSAFQRVGPFVSYPIIGGIADNYSIVVAVLIIGVFSLFSLLVPLSKELFED